MPEQIQKILERVLEWWKKFNNKQRILLISITAGVLLALGILAYAVSRPTMVELIICENAKQASEVNTLLSSDSSIHYEVSNDGLQFKVDVRDEAAASYLLAANEIPTMGYSIENVTDGSLSTTEADKQKKYEYYLESKFADHLGQMDYIDSATVDITLPDNDGTILSKDQEGTAAVKLELAREIDEDKAYGIARFIATELGNETTKGITIVDSKGNLLYSGADSENSFSAVSSQLNYKQKQETLVAQKIETALRESGMFAEVHAAANLDVDFSNIDEATHEYYTTDGSATGPISSQSTYDAESNGDVGAIPGTDANDDTGYVLDNGEYGSYTVSETDTKYDTSERITNRTSSGGNIQYDSSSVSVIATRYITYEEDQLEASGQLDDMTFEEFKTANNERQQVEASEEDIQAIANITGFPVENISLICYEEPRFVESDSSGRALSDILQIVLAVLIFALLAYVVFRSTRKQPEPEPEPELSVEALLESTAEQDALDDIGYSEKSEVRILIEKFVDENPDAVAMLLRNWLNEDWE